MTERKELVFENLVKYAIKFVVVALCAFVIYEQFKHFNDSVAQRNLLLQSVKQNGWILLIVVALMPLNWLIETKKWQLLLAAESPQPFSKLLKAVLQGVMVGTVTPWRMGEFVGRTFEMKRSEAVNGFYFSMLGGMAQAFITAIFGLFFLPWFYPSPLLIGFAVVVCGILLCAYFFFHRLPLQLIPFVKNKVAHIKPSSNARLGMVLLLSLCRYLIYLSQWTLVAYTFSVHNNLLLLAAGAAVTLLLQSVSPALPFFDLAVRSGISLFVFSNICSNPMAILLSVLVVWLINIAIPSIGGIAFFLHGWKMKKSTSVFASQANVEHFNSK